MTLLHLVCWPCLPRQGYFVFRFIIEYIVAEVILSPRYVIIGLFYFYIRIFER
jgi:hypothetical protein